MGERINGLEEMGNSHEKNTVCLLGYNVGDFFLLGDGRL